MTLKRRRGSLHDAGDQRLARRREALRLFAGAAIGGLGSAAGLGAADLAASRSNDPGEEALDEALRILRETGPETRQGLSSHAPMVAEALAAVGQGERAVPWVRAYRGPMLRLPGPIAPISGDDWRSALGPRPGAPSWEESLHRWADWHAFFTARLDEAPWRGVLDTWVGRLAPGICSAATHGVIRTAHAARGLSRRASALRRDELARGLAYWAASYQELPARAAAAAPLAAYEAAFARLPLYADAHARYPPGNIVSGLEAAGVLPGFAAARDLVAERDDVSAALSDLTLAAARAYLRHGTEGRSVATIAFVHAVTGPAALRRLAPFVRAETARRALPYAWQAVAGIYAAYARRDNRERDFEAKGAPDELVARAVANGDDHAIKFTEALLGEHALRPHPAYLAAAEDAVARL
jgi:hypothetical protein